METLSDNVKVASWQRLFLQARTCMHCKAATAATTSVLMCGAGSRHPANSFCRGRTSGNTSENIPVALAASSHGSLSRHAQRAQCAWPSSASRGSLGVGGSAQILTCQDKCEVCCRTSNLWQPVIKTAQSHAMLANLAYREHQLCQCLNTFRNRQGTRNLKPFTPS